MFTAREAEVGTDRQWSDGNPPGAQGWLYRLTDDEADEIDRAFDVLIRSPRAGLKATQADFPLPTLGVRLHDIVASLESAPGFAVIRGLPIASRSESEVRQLYWGLGLHMGVAIPQNQHRDLVVDIRDHGAGTAASTRGYGSNAKLDFHVDSCDVVSLLCRRTAQSGGESLLCSSQTVADTITRKHPQFAEVLRQPFPMQKVGVAAETERRFTECPIFGEEQGFFTSRFFRSRILDSQNDPAAPRLTDDQRQALELVEQTARELSIGLNFQPGDIQLVNNHLIYHSRKGFDDHAEPDKRRHLLRLWLATAHTRPLPNSFGEVWGDVRAGSIRGGVQAFRSDEAIKRYQHRAAADLGFPHTHR